MKKKSILIIAILFLVVGFATVTTNLIINGNLLIGNNEDDFVVIFTSAKLNGVNKNKFISSDKKTITFETNTLTTLVDEEVLEFEVTNTSRNYNANVVISCTPTEHEYLNLSLPSDMTVEAGNTETNTLIASLKKVTSESQSIEITCTLTATAEERTELGEEYEENNTTLIKFTSTYETKEYCEYDPRLDYTRCESYKEEVLASFWKYRENITKVVFENKMNLHETSENLIFDVSENQNESVMAYLVFPYSSLSDEEKEAKFEEYIQNEYGMDLGELYSSFMEEGTTAGEAYRRIDDMKEEQFNSCTLYIQSGKKIKANEDSSYLFYKFTNLKEINGLEYLDTSNVTNMGYMFCNCDNLTSLDVSNFDTSNVTNMRSMFYGFPDDEFDALTSLDISNFDTSKVTDMRYMFSGRTSLTDLYLGRIDINDNADTYGMFSGTPNEMNIHVVDGATMEWILEVKNQEVMLG